MPKAICYTFSVELQHSYRNKTWHGIPVLWKRSVEAVFLQDFSCFIYNEAVTELEFKIPF